ncbi:hypothetical protein WDW89_09965 [Deltaproteobacteria bacterium TL4]
MKHRFILLILVCLIVTFLYGFGGGKDEPPKQGVQGLSFTDTSLAQGKLSGSLIIRRATDESDIDDYIIELGINRGGSSEYLDIDSLQKTGRDLNYEFSDYVLPDYYRVDQKTLQYLDGYTIQDHGYETGLSEKLVFVFSYAQYSTYKAEVIYNREDFLEGLKLALGEHFDEYQELVLSACILTTTEMEYQFIVKTANDHGTNNKNAEGFLIIEDRFLPRDSAKSVQFSNTDTDEGEISGLVEIQKANIEDDSLTHYVLYWGETSVKKLNGYDSIVTLSKTGEDLSYEILPNTVVPSNAMYLLVFTRNDYGEMDHGIYFNLLDNQLIKITTPLRASSDKIVFTQGMDEVEVEFSVNVKGKVSHVIVQESAMGNSNWSSIAGLEEQYSNLMIGRHFTGTAIYRDVNRSYMSSLRILVLDSNNEVVFTDTPSLMLPVVVGELETAGETINTSTGGELHFADGIKLEIPPNSLTSNTEIRIQKDSQNLLFFFEPDGLESSKPMTLTIPVTEQFKQLIGDKILTYRHYSNQYSIEEDDLEPEVLMRLLPENLKVGKDIKLQLHHFSSAAANTKSLVIRNMQGNVVFVKEVGMPVDANNAPLTTMKPPNGSNGMLVLSSIDVNPFITPKNCAYITDPDITNIAGRTLSGYYKGISLEPGLTIHPEFLYYHDYSISDLNGRVYDVYIPLHPSADVTVSSVPAFTIQENSTPVSFYASDWIPFSIEIPGFLAHQPPLYFCPPVGAWGVALSDLKIGSEPLIRFEKVYPIEITSFKVFRNYLEKNSLILQARALLNGCIGPQNDICDVTWSIDFPDLQNTSWGGPKKFDTLTEWGKSDFLMSIPIPEGTYPSTVMITATKNNSGDSFSIVRLIPTPKVEITKLELGEALFWGTPIVESFISGQTLQHRLHVVANGMFSSCMGSCNFSWKIEVYDNKSVWKHVQNFNQPTVTTALDEYMEIWPAPEITKSDLVTGSEGRPGKLETKITFTENSSGKVSSLTVTQDSLDALRQEYVDYSAGVHPFRSEFVNTHPHLSSVNDEHRVAGVKLRFETIGFDLQQKYIALMPFNLSSGYRNPSKNLVASTKIGNPTPNGPHIYGIALDFDEPNSEANCNKAIDSGNTIPRPYKILLYDQNHKSWNYTNNPPACTSLPNGVSEWTHGHLEWDK